MPYLAAATQTLQILWDSAPSAEGAWWVDYAAMTAAGTAVEPHTLAGMTTGATPVAIMPAPSSGLVNCLINLAVRNAGSAAKILHVQLKDGSSTFPVLETTVASGDTLCFNSRDGWYTLTGAGERKVTTGSGGGGGGTVTVSNFPATQPVSGTFWQATQPVSGTVSVSNFPSVQQVDGSAVTQPVSGTVSVSNFPSVQQVDGSAVTQPVSGTVAVSNFPSTYAVTGTFWQATQPVSIVAGSEIIGKVEQEGTWTVQPGNTANTTPWLVTQAPVTSGGDALYSVLSSGASNQDAAVIKGTPGSLRGYGLFNTTSTARYAKLYNLASGATAASTPALRIFLPPSGGANVSFPDGIDFGTGLSIRLTTGPADNDAGTCSANDVLANVWYK